MSSRERPPAEETPDSVRDKVLRALRNRARLAALEDAHLLDSALALPALDRAARLACASLRTPVAQVVALDEKRVVPLAVCADASVEDEQWRASRPVGNSYAKYVVWTRAPFVVDDAAEHLLVRYAYATRDLGIVSYLGVPVYGPMPARGRAPVLGTVQVVDVVPRDWSERDVETLSDIAGVVSDEIAHRIRTRAEVQAAENQTARLLDAMDIGVLATDAAGVITFANETAARMLGWALDEITGHDQHALVHHSRLDGSRYFESECPYYLSRGNAEALHMRNDLFWRSDGTPLPVDTTMTPILERGEVIGTVLTFAPAGEG